MDPSDDIQANPVPSPAPARRDALTILRILLLTAGVAVGIQVFGWEKDKLLLLPLANAVVIGLSLPAPLFVVGRARQSPGAMGPGSMFAMTMGIGSLLLLPPPIIAKLVIARESSAPLCLYYVMPLAAIWFLLGALLAGQISRRLFDRGRTPWTERYGYFLAVLWSPLGVYHLVNFYREAMGYNVFK